MVTHVRHAALERLGLGFLGPDQALLVRRRRLHHVAQRHALPRHVLLAFHHEPQILLRRLRVSGVFEDHPCVNWCSFVGRPTGSTGHDGKNGPRSIFDAPTVRFGSTRSYRPRAELCRSDRCIGEPGPVPLQATARACAMNLLPRGREVADGPDRVSPACIEFHRRESDQNSTGGPFQVSSRGRARASASAASHQPSHALRPGRRRQTFSRPLHFA